MVELSGAPEVAVTQPDPSNAAPTTPPTRAPHWKSLAAVLVALDFVLIVVDSISIVGLFRWPIGGFPLEASALAWVHLTAIVLGLVMAIPVLLLLDWSARRAGLPRGAVLVAGLLAGAVFLIEGGRLHDLIALGGGLRAPGASVDVEAVILAPAIEEPLKLVVLLALAAWLRPRSGIRQGLVVGAAAGLAINLIEAGIYVQRSYGQQTNAIYGTVLATRFGLFGLGLHLATAALIGAAVWKGLSVPVLHRRVAVLGSALAAAIGVHGFWNLLATPLLLRFVEVLAPHPNLDSFEPVEHHLLWIASSTLTLIVVGPLLLLLAVVWRRGRRRPPRFEDAVPTGD
jgi:RsiW-degrading membrane proteinase PrsW (M82 family)